MDNSENKSACPLHIIADEKAIGESVFVDLEAFYGYQKELIQKIYILHSLMELVIGASIAGLAQYTEVNLEFQTRTTAGFLLFLYAIVAISTFKSICSPETKQKGVIYIMSLAEFVVGLSLFMVSFEMFLPILLNVDRPLENLRIYEYVWFSTYLGSVSTILLAFCPSLNFTKSATYLKMVQICITQIVLIDLFPFSWVEMQFYSPYIYGFIALANNIGVCFLVKKHRELVPKVMEVIGMKMEEESGNSGRLRRSATWEDVITAYVPVLIESDDSF